MCDEPALAPTKPESAGMNPVGVAAGRPEMRRRLPETARVPGRGETTVDLDPGVFPD